MYLRLSVALAAALALTSVVPAAPAPKARAKKVDPDVVKRMTGTWQMVSTEYVNGGQRTVSKASVNSAQIRVENGNWSYLLRQANLPAGAAGAIVNRVSTSYKIEPKKGEHPNAIDLVRDLAQLQVIGGRVPVPANPKVAANVYMTGTVFVEGDTMKWCYTFPHRNVARPTDPSNLTDGHYLMTLKRVGN